MERQYSEVELNVVDSVGNEMREVGYDLVTDEGLKKNREAFFGFLGAHPEIPVTREVLINFLNQNRHLFAVRSPMLQRWDKAVAQCQRSAEELDQFIALMGSVGAGLHLPDPPSEDFFFDAALILPELLGRQITRDTFIQAVGRLTPKSQGSRFGSKETLIFKAERVTPDPRRGIHTSSERHKPGMLFSKDEVNQSGEGRFRSHTEEQPTPQTQQAKRENDAWSRIHDGWCSHGSHGQQQALNEVRAREVARNNGSERLASAAIEAAYKSIHKTRPVVPTAPEVIASMGKR